MPLAPRAERRATLLLLANLCATGMLVGLIWTIQLVHYPLLRAVGPEALPGYLAEHATRITILVAPWMIGELVTAGLLLRWTPTAVPRWMVGVGFACCIGIWASTLLVQVPLHARLAETPDPGLLDRLTLTNWLRTVGWTARGTLCLLMAWRLVATPETVR
jgi:hypothetical protein